MKATSSEYEIQRTSLNEKNLFHNILNTKYDFAQDCIYSIASELDLPEFKPSIYCYLDKYTATATHRKFVFLFRP